MPAYRYRATTAEGRIRRGSMVAASEPALAATLAEGGLDLIAARALAGHGDRTVVGIHGAVRPLKRPRERITPERRAALAAQLADLLAGGMPLLPALNHLAQAEPEGPFHDRLTALARSVAQGCMLAEAARTPPLFNAVGLAILTAGEQSGDIVAALRRVHDQTQRTHALTRMTVRALRRPIFLLTVAGGAVAFMMGAVVPEVTALLASLGRELPLATRLLIALSDGVAHGGWIVVTALALGMAAAMLARRGGGMLARLVDAAWLRLPGLGPILYRLALARFTDSLAALLRTSLDAPGCLDAASGVLGNHALAARARSAATRVRHGERLSMALEGLVPPLAARALDIGEQGARLAPTLLDLSRQFETEAADRIATLLGALEPALTLLVGALLAWVVLAVLGPVYGSLGLLSGGG